MNYKLIKNVLAIGLLFAIVSSVLFSISLGWAQSDVTLFKYLFSGVAIAFQFFLFVMLGLAYLFYTKEQWLAVGVAGLLVVGLAYFDHQGTVGALKTQSAQKEAKAVSESGSYVATQEALSSLSSQISEKQALMSSQRDANHLTRASQTSKEIDALVAQQAEMTKTFTTLETPATVGYTSFYAEQGKMMNSNNYQMVFYNFIAIMLTSCCVFIPFFLTILNDMEKKDSKVSEHTPAKSFTRSTLSENRSPEKRASIEGNKSRLTFDDFQPQEAEKKKFIQRPIIE